MALLISLSAFRTTALAQGLDIKIETALSEAARGELLESLAQCQARSEHLLGQQLSQNLTLYIVPGYKAAQVLAQRHGVHFPKVAEGIAFSHAQAAIVVAAHPTTSQPVVLDTVGCHELAHLLLGDAVQGHAVPRWFNEGFAINASRENRISRAKALYSSRVRHVPLERLDRAFFNHASQIDLAYAEAGDAVSYLMRYDGDGGEDGKKRLKKLISDLRRGTSFEEALKARYGLSIAGLEVEWRKDLSGRQATLIGGGGFLGLGWLVLLPMAMLKLRRRRKAKEAQWQAEQEAAERRRELRPSRAGRSAGPAKRYG